MENQKLIEKELLTVQFGHERFRVTDKRLLYIHHQNEVFIGIDELRGAAIKEEQVKQYKYNYSPKKIGLLFGVLAYIGLVLYPSLTNDGDFFSTFMAGAILGMIGGFGVLAATAIVVGLLTWIFQELTSQKVNMIHFTITQRDGKIWYDNYFTINSSQPLNKLTDQINACIYQ